MTPLDPVTWIRSAGTSASDANARLASAAMSASALRNWAGRCGRAPDRNRRAPHRHALIAKLCAIGTEAVPSPVAYLQGNLVARRGQSAGELIDHQLRASIGRWGNRDPGRRQQADS